ncbi:9148_t:CDS:1, partial [Entrophospora sp. SA101]
PLQENAYFGFYDKFDCEDEARSVELAIRILALYVTFEFEDEARCAELLAVVSFV